MKKYQMYIGGEWCDASDGKTADVINPSNEEVIAQVPLGTEKDADRAIQAARESYESGVWQNMAPAERSRIMLDILNTFKQKAMDFATLETQNLGAPMS